MDIDQNLIPIFAIGVGLIIAVTGILSNAISKYKLKVEQIRADAMVKAEEARARSQFELEKLIREERAEYSQEAPADNGTDQHTNNHYDEISRSRNRVRD